MSKGGLKKPWTRRLAPEHSQRIRRLVQGIFFAVNLWIGVEFLYFVLAMEGRPGWWTPDRPAGVEGWLPIAGLMGTRYWALTGHLPDIHPAAAVLFTTFLGLSLLMRKAFCGWLCPVGALSEQLWKWGRGLFGRNWALPRWLDIPLRGLKYLLAGFFLWAVLPMSADDIGQFFSSPYALVADVKMLDFFRFLSRTAAVVLVVLVVASVFVQNFWCRYLCPYGALMGLAALASPLRIRRDPAACIDCAKCAKACPSQLPVDRLVQIRSAECLGCLECVSVCPAEGALAMSAAGRRPIPAWLLAAAVCLLFVAAVGAAKATGNWDGAVSETMYRKLIPMVRDLGHP